MADYSRFLFDAVGSIGDTFTAKRQEGRRNMESDRDYKRALGLDDWKKSTDQRDFNYRGTRDQVGDNQWERNYGRGVFESDRSYGLAERKLAQDKSGSADYGLSPVWGTDADGNPALVQLGKNGQPIQPQLPEGFKIARDPIKMDAGTHFVLLDPQTRQQIGTIPKDVSGEAREKVAGTAQGGAQMALPGAQQNLADVQAKIASLRDDPYLENMLGPWDSRTPDYTENAGRVKSKMDQLQGESFMQARQLLKGAGGVTDYEGQKADQAMSRLNRAQSPADYKQALNDFQTHIENGFRIMEQQAQRGGQQQGGAGQQQRGGDALGKARAAIAAGADPRAVAERLRRVGIDPSGL